MKEQNGFLIENEKQANKLAAQVMQITFLVFSLVFVLNIVGVFKVDKTIMAFAYVVGSVLLIVPSLMVMKFKMKSWFVKYLIVFGNVILVTLLSVTLTYHVVVFYVYPVAIASLYFSKKLNIIATAFTVVGVSVGQIIAFFVETTQDDNFTDMSGVIIFGVIPRALILIALAAIFTALGSRTAKMLSSLMGAEEQELMLNRMRKMQDSASASSEKLFEMVSELSRISNASLASNQSIVKETESLLQSSVENTEAAIQADKGVQDIREQLSQLNGMNHHTLLLSEQIGDNTRQNRQRMNDATEAMNQIHESTDECKAVITDLGNESQEIIGIVETIKSISSRTNILALNATIEAARAGEQGKGFAVVAEEIQKLSEQTKTAVEGIGAIVHQVVGNTEKAVTAMEQSVVLTKQGMEYIQSANESSSLIATSNEELIQQIRAIDQTAESIEGKSVQIAESMDQISNNIKNNSKAIEMVTAATQENTAGAESLAEFIVNVKGLSEQLNLVVHEQ